jgi:hypothetical protein
VDQRRLEKEERRERQGGRLNFAMELECAHAVHAAILGPATECLAFPPEEDAEEAPDGDESGVGHDGGDEAGCVSHSVIN